MKSFPPLSIYITDRMRISAPPAHSSNKNIPNCIFSTCHKNLQKKSKSVWTRHPITSHSLSFVVPSLIDCSHPFIKECEEKKHCCWVLLAAGADCDCCERGFRRRTDCGSRRTQTTAASASQALRICTFHFSSLRLSGGRASIFLLSDNKSEDGYCNDKNYSSRFVITYQEKCGAEKGRW